MSELVWLLWAELYVEEAPSSDRSVMQVLCKGCLFVHLLCTAIYDQYPISERHLWFNTQIYEPITSQSADIQYSASGANLVVLLLLLVGRVICRV